MCPGTVGKMCIRGAFEPELPDKIHAPFSQNTHEQNSRKVADIQVVICGPVHEIGHLAQCQDSGKEGEAGHQYLCFSGKDFSAEAAHIRKSPGYCQKKKDQYGNISTWIIRKIHPKKAVHIRGGQQRE